MLTLHRTFKKKLKFIFYRDVPGIDTAYLAMDTEEGVEVVWNEAVFSGSKKFKNKEEDKLKNVFEALTLIDHPNIVKFKEWYETNRHLWLVIDLCSTGFRGDPR